MADESNLAHEITELRLGLPGDIIVTGKKRVSSEVESELKCEPATKSQVVGWPPVCSFRRKNSLEETRTAYVKVSVDGAAFLRKIDLKMYKHDTLKESECVPIYEDKDGDWMLAGDVPWEMFVASCKRLRVMKRSVMK
ncbi:hypothetical protein YC2023_103890 [Brassica napus]|uniref:Auxin-responsive protein n=2 Tax=Brassica oleracea TaxID=3712 RepID=A0A0D3DX46_BRAOL|nr:unnamed protein product [Brassica oleracea]